MDTSHAMLSLGHAGLADAFQFGSVTRNDATITAALGTLGAASTLLLVPFSGDGVWTLNSPHTFPATMQVVFGAGVTVAGSGALTFGRPPWTLSPAPWYVGTGVVTMGAPRSAVVWAHEFASLTGGAQIQAALNSLPATGGTVLLAPGTYDVSTTLTLGTGGVGVASSRHGVILQGVALPSSQGADSPVRLRWTGASGGTLLRVQGPLIGWGVSNLHLDGNGLAAKSLEVVSGEMGACHNLVCTGHTLAGIYSTAVPVFAPLPNTNSMHNQWTNIRIFHSAPAGANSAGVLLQTTGPTSNTCVNTFTGLFVVVQGVPGYALYLGGTDTNTFYNTHLFTDATALGNIVLDHSNPGSALWPCGNNFYGLVMSAYGVTVLGTPAAGERAANMFWGYQNQGAAPGANYFDFPSVGSIYHDINSQHMVLTPQQGADLRLFTTVAHPRHFTPTVHNTANLGADSSRWKDLYLSGGVLRPIRSATGNTTLSVFTDWYLKINNPGGSTTVTLGSAVGVAGRDYFVDNETVNNVVLTPSGGQLINALSSFTLDANPSAAHIISDGANWRILSTHGVH